jgi:argininosuccinate lyase
MSNLWSGRFDTAPDAAAFEFGASFRFDRRLFEDDVTGSIAWARAIAKAGVLPADEAAQIESALTTLLERGRSEPDFVSGADEDVHSFVERLLVEQLGDAGRRLHTGRSRNEQVSLDLRLYLRRRIPLLQRGVAGVIGALADQAAAAAQILLACVVLGALAFRINAEIAVVVLIALVASLTLLSVSFYVAEWVRHMNAASP